jgi:hypothetical protein
MKSTTIFCDTTPRSPLKVNDVSEKHIASIFRVDLFDSEDGGDMFLRNVG